MAAHPAGCIVNLDETSWRLINKQMSTIADMGADAVEYLFEGDQKMCMTAIASVDAAGGKNPSGFCGRARRTDTSRATVTMSDSTSRCEGASWC
jgi:hypothetical protein